MTADNGLVSRHGYNTTIGICRKEGGVNAKSKHKRKSGRQARSQLIQICVVQPKIIDSDVFEGIRVAIIRRLHCELALVVGPVVLVAYACVGDRLYAITKISPTIRIDGSLHVTLVVVN